MGVDVLLDVDPSVGQGVYNPELEEPEHCHAASSALWELTLLQVSLGTNYYSFGK